MSQATQEGIPCGAHVSDSWKWTQDIQASIVGKKTRTEWGWGRCGGVSQGLEQRHSHAVPMGAGRLPQKQVQLGLEEDQVTTCLMPSGPWHRMIPEAELCTLVFPLPPLPMAGNTTHFLWEKF